MDRATPLDALLALLDGPDTGTDGATLTRTLGSAGLRTSPDRLLRDLLRLEESGHVTVERPGYSFAVTDLGRAAVVDLGPGVAVDATIVIVDLVGFVAFTDEHGDAAAVGAAQRLRHVADAELRRSGGRLVKHLGDGILGTLPPSADGVAVIAAIAHALRHADGSRWPLRAAVRAGRPIALGGDVFGADVNVVARLCSLAAPCELVVGVTGPGADGLVGVEQVDVRGLAQPVPVVRIPL